MVLLLKFVSNISEGISILCVGAFVCGCMCTGLEITAVFSDIQVFSAMLKSAD